MCQKSNKCKKRNESDIDLATYDKSITVQVTAQKDYKKGKIEKTIKGFKNRKIKQGYKSQHQQQHSSGTSGINC